MLLSICKTCKNHEVREDSNGRRSFCQKENCWSMYSQCINKQAINEYMAKQDSMRNVSVLEHTYNVL